MHILVINGQSSCCSVISPLIFDAAHVPIISTVQTHELQLCLRIGSAVCIRLGRPHTPRPASCHRVVGHGRNRGHCRPVGSLPDRTRCRTPSPPPSKRTRSLRAPENKQRVSQMSQVTACHCLQIKYLRITLFFIGGSCNCDTDSNYMIMLNNVIAEREGVNTKAHYCTRSRTAIFKIPLSQPVSPKSILLLSSCLLLLLLCGHFPREFQTKILYALLILFTISIFIAHRSLL